MAQCNHKVAVICLTLLTLTTTTTTTMSRFVTRMIHRDSVDSPYYSPDSSTEELADRARESSRSRLAYLASGDHRARISANIDGVFFMAKISIGDPPYPQFFLIDTGSSLTWLQCLASALAPRAYGPLSKEVRGLLDGALERVESQKRLCYKGAIERELAGFPVVTFDFEGGAELGLDTLSLFKRHSDEIFCMAMEESPFDISVIGVMAQQSYNIGYDLVHKKISFQRTDCDVYEKLTIANSYN